MGTNPHTSLDLRSGACFFQLLLDRVRVGLRHAFLDGRRNAFDQVLGFLEAQAGDFADDLDDANLVGAEAGHGHVELGLLFDDRSSSGSATASSSNSHGSSGADAPLLFEALDQFNNVEHLQIREGIDQFFLSNSHCRNSKQYVLTDSNAAASG